MIESFETSEATDKLDEAIAKIQGELKAADKSAENPGFKRDGKPMKYADLAAVWDSCREIIAKNGVSAMQFPIQGEDPTRLYIMTRIAHSGQWIKAVFSMPVAMQTPQGFGSAITYARRYTLSAALGIVSEEDDDGNAASQGGARQPKQDQRQPSNQSTNQSTMKEPAKLTEAQETITAAIKLALSQCQGREDVVEVMTKNAGAIKAMPNADWITGLAIFTEIGLCSTRPEVIDVMANHEATLDRLPNGKELRDHGRAKIREIAQAAAEAAKQRELEEAGA